MLTRTMGLDSRTFFDKKDGTSKTLGEVIEDFEFIVNLYKKKLLLESSEEEIL